MSISGESFAHYVPKGCSNWYSNIGGAAGLCYLVIPQPHPQRKDSVAEKVRTIKHSVRCAEYFPLFGGMSGGNYLITFHAFVSEESCLKPLNGWKPLCWRKVSSC